MTVMGHPDPLLLAEDELGLVTDLYQLTMFAAYPVHVTSSSRGKER